MKKDLYRRPAKRPFKKDRVRKRRYKKLLKTLAYFHRI